MVTLGDPFPDLAVVRAEAQTLRRHPEARMAFLRESERNQASGRGRPIWGEPKLIVHVGKWAPSLRWAPQWATMKTIKLAAGQTPKTLPGGMTVAEHERLRASRGLSMKAYAKENNVSFSTYRDHVRRALIAKATATVADHDDDAVLDGTG